MSDKTILSQRLNEQLNDFRKAMDKFAESCIKIVEKYGLSSDETECEQPDTDTISRQDAINLIERYCDNGCEIAEDKWCPDCQRSKFAEMIKALPPSPSRPKGKWIPQNLNKSDGMISTAVYYYPKCSVCGASANYTNFCPNCGADMTEGE